MHHRLVRLICLPLLFLGVSQNNVLAAEATSDDVIQDTLSDGTLGPELVVIRVGAFAMGSPEDEAGRYKNEQLHEVTLENDFAIGRYEISFDEYDLFAQATERELPSDSGWGRGKNPVIHVSWNDAVAYTEWLSAQTGASYRLPTEAEWEYSTRGNTQSAYWWGDSFESSKLNCHKCDTNEDISSPKPVGQYPANAFGLYDVLGNVWEWTCSNYHDNYKDAKGAENTCSANRDDSNKAIRGGSYQNSPEVKARFGNTKRQPLRSAVRDKFYPDDSNDIIGFRVVREL